MHIAFVIKKKLIFVFSILVMLSWGEAKQDSSNVSIVFWFQPHNRKPTSHHQYDIFPSSFVIICSLEEIFRDGKYCSF
jgi:hypothetical protein